MTDSSEILTQKFLVGNYEFGYCNTTHFKTRYPNVEIIGIYNIPSSLLDFINRWTSATSFLNTGPVFFKLII
jgi:hypothetical protein